MKKVSPGDRVELSAKDWNKFLETAKKVDAIARVVQGFERQFVQSSIIKLRNDSGGGLARYSILKISDSIIKPSDNELHFKQRPALVGVTPTDESEPFVVLYEPAKPGATVRAIVCGAAICKVNVLDTNHNFVRATEENPAYLTSADSGSTEILWKEPADEEDEEDEGTGVRWAVIRFGSGGGETEYGCILSTSISGSGTATADIVKYENFSEVIEEDATVYSPGTPPGIFNGGASGAEGVVVKKNGLYYLRILGCGS